MVAQLLDFLSPVADILSVGSFVAATYSALTLRDLERRVVGRARLPSLIDGLKGLTAELEVLLSDHAGRRTEIRLIFARLSANLASLKNHARESQRSVAATQKVVAEYDRRRYFAPNRSDPHEQAWTAYAALVGLIEELELLDADRKFRS